MKWSQIEGKEYRETAEYHILSVPRDGFLATFDLESPLYTQVELDPVVEGIEREEPALVAEAIEETQTGWEFPS